MGNSCQVCGKGGELCGVSKTDFTRVCFECYKTISEGGVTNMGELQDYIKRNSKTVMLKDGETIEVVYRGFKIGANRFDPEKESVYYSLETEFGVKSFQSGALGLANIFDNISEGSKIRLTRHGEGNKTKYKVEVFENGEWVAIGRPDEDED